MALSVGVASPGSGLTAQRSTHGTAYVASPAPRQTLTVAPSTGGLGNVTAGAQSAGGFGGASQSGLNVQAVNPFNYGPTGAGAVLASSTSDPTTDAGTGGVSAAQSAADKANSIKSAITGLIGNIKGVYDALYGDVGNVTTDKANQVTNQYGQDVKALTDQFNGQFPQIGQGYGARGTYDSSYRINAEKAATDEFGNANTALAQSRDQDLAKAGQYLAEQQAGINSQKGALDQLQARIAESQNPDELTALQNTLTERLNTLQTSRASNQTQGSYLQQLNAAVPASTAINNLKTSLGNVLNSAVPQPIKLAIAGQLVSQSGLNGDDQRKLLAEFQSQAGTDDKQLV